MSEDVLLLAVLVGGDDFKLEPGVTLLAPGGGGNRTLSAPDPLAFGRGFALDFFYF